jgi:hypothetical protein
VPDRRSAFRIAVVDDRGRCDNSAPPRWAGGRKISCSNFTNSALRCDRGQGFFRAGLSQVNRRCRRESGRSGIPYTVGSFAPKAVARSSASGLLTPPARRILAQTRPGREEQNGRN